MKNTILKKNIANIARKKGYSYGRIEEEAGLHKHFISHMINNDRMPRIDAMINIADILEISLDELVGRSKTYFPNKFRKIVEDESLFGEVVHFLSTHLKKENPTGYNLNAVFNFLETCYQYSLDQNDGQFEESFAEYLFKKTFS